MSLETSEGPLQRVRFTSDLASSERIAADAELMKHVQWAQRTGRARSIRQRLLSDAAKIDSRVLPGLADAFENVITRAKLRHSLEAYVHASAEINAAVVAGRDRKLVLLTSGAIEKLKPDELNFVIGHELGHAEYGHSDIPVGLVLSGSPGLRPHQAMQLMAWHRQAEISADRAGLLCCGSLRTAATAMFKTLSGLAVEGLQINPQEYAKQWDELAVEVRRDAATDHWLAAHPFPPLRMKALLSFCDADDARDMIPGAAGGRSLSHVDQEIDHLLAMMDPLAREQSEESGCGDPVLRDFLLWGGLYIAAANGKVEESELANITLLVGEEAVRHAEGDINKPPGVLRDRFLQAKAERVRPLSALELHRILSGVAAIAKADGSVDDDEIEALHQLARDCGVSESFVDSLL